MIIFQEIGLLNWKFSYQQKLMALSTLAIILLGLNFALFYTSNIPSTANLSSDSLYDLACNETETMPLSIKSYIEL